MNELAILTNRKRAIIALVHSVVFLLLATWQMMGGNPALGVFAVAHVSAGTWAVTAIYVVVSSILLWLFGISRGWIEKLYFGFCTISATSGLIRTLLGDQRFHSGRPLRVAMLMSAVIVGLVILRLQSALMENKLEV